MRNIVGAVIALLGAAAAVLSPFRAGYDGRHGSDLRVQDLFNGITMVDADLLASVFLPMAFAAFVAVIGVVLRSRVLVALSGLLVLLMVALWLTRQADTPQALHSDLVGEGMVLAFGGGLLLLIGAVVMNGRRRRRARHRAGQVYPPEPPAGGHGDGRPPEDTEPGGHLDTPQAWRPGDTS
ncbi:hypothetical protein [Wenjunlia tyrosinilytica]|jgi:hypothetical protein|uniref:Uncharacterized protein n=1 Tax=Wenjunlia tyrosinilytica TaxID=1544741 RepID=A0A917ZNH0_9ACTN|nr:hypothetical protein [Wenjunlia tyrosinilytica]GGO86733.1 hypothetical protein GCM10012280_23510 [Wenjunlia tyrosinilytica]